MKAPFLYDLHVHTPFSDGQVDFDTMLGILTRLNVEFVGFADHVFPGAMYVHSRTMPICPGLTNCFSESTLRRRKAVFRLLQRKHPRITILHSGEVDTFPDGTLALPPGITPDFFRDAGSYLMVAKHHTIPKQLNYIYKHRGAMMPTDPWAWRYSPRLRLNALMWEKGVYATFARYHPDVLAHPHETMPLYLPEHRVRRLLLSCKKHGVAYELNYAEKPRTYLKEVFTWGEKYQTPFTIASDFHGFGRKPFEDIFNEGLEIFELAERWNLNIVNPEKYLQDRSRRGNP
ncbi:MAG: hypothetical protein GYA24_08755 [Candidatus Lokiarchaeota archaeon]|nr:hypothetical protein [Candidatus Lokiarchaeota archaeon]